MARGEPIGGGIRVKRETIIILSDAPELCLRNGMAAKSGDIDTQVQQYGQRKLFRKLSNASSLISEIFSHPDTSENLLRRKIKRANDRDTSKELLDFLRNASPPPENFMSFPEPYEVLPKNKKKKRPFWPLWWRRAKEGGSGINEPPLLRLPDTAVAGRTTGGHRHIAISIPIEYAHLEGASKADIHRKPEPMPPPIPKRSASRMIQPAPGFREFASEMPRKTIATPPLIPPISYEAFHSFLTPDEALETSSSNYFDSGPTSPITTGDLSVGLRSLFVTPSPQLTPRHQGSVSSFISIINEGPARPLHHPRLRLSDSQHPLRDHPSIAESITTNGTEPVISSATTAHGFVSPRIVAVESPSNYNSPGMQTVIYSPEFNLDTSRGPNLGTSSSLSHRDFNYSDDPTTILHHSGYGIHNYHTLSPMPSGYLSDSLALDKFLSRPEMACPLCMTPVMRVSDRGQPSSSRQSTPDLSHFVTARPSLTSANSSFSPCCASTPKPAQAQLNAPRRYLYSPIPPVRELRRSDESLRHRLARSESHWDLIRRHRELSQRRDSEMDLILERLERLEMYNERWLGAVMPLFEKLTRGLLATQGVWEDGRDGSIRREEVDGDEDAELSGLETVEPVMRGILGQEGEEEEEDETTIKPIKRVRSEGGEVGIEGEIGVALGGDPLRELAEGVESLVDEKVESNVSEEEDEV